MEASYTVLSVFCLLMFHVPPTRRLVPSHDPQKSHPVYNIRSKSVTLSPKSGLGRDIPWAWTSQSIGLLTLLLLRYQTGGGDAAIVCGAPVQEAGTWDFTQLLVSHSYFSIHFFFCDFGTRSLP